ERQVRRVRAHRIGVPGDEEPDRRELSKLADGVFDQLEALLEFLRLRGVDVEGPAPEIDLLVRDVDPPWEQIDAAEESVRVDRLERDPEHRALRLLPRDPVLAALLELAGLGARRPHRRPL